MLRVFLLLLPQKNLVQLRLCPGPGLPESPHQNRETAQQAEQIQYQQMPLIPGLNLPDLRELFKAPEDLHEITSLEGIHCLNDLHRAVDLVGPGNYRHQDDHAERCPPLAQPSGQLPVALEDGNGHCHAENRGEGPGRPVLKHDHRAAQQRTQQRTQNAPANPLLLRFFLCVHLSAS